MSRKTVVLLALLGVLVVTAAQAQVKHVEMRVEGMT